MNQTSIESETRESVVASGPDDGVIIAVLRSAGRLQDRLDSALVAVGLSISKFDALEQLIAADQPLALGDLAGRLNCVRSNVTQLVDRLEADGLVKRGSCPEDRRSVRAMVTPVGIERHAAGVSAIRAVQAELADRVGAQDRVAVIRLLGALTG